LNVVEDATAPDTVTETAVVPSAEAIDALANEANEKLAISLADEKINISKEPTIDSEQNETPAETPQNGSGQVSPGLPPADAITGTYEIIEVPLTFDAEFFEMLQSDVNHLDALQSEEEKTMTSEIVALGKEVEQVVKPKRFSRTDLARWRQIFELYLDAEIFFATHEQDHGHRTSQKALKQLELVQDFKLPESKVAFTRFINLNASLLKNMQFQELNKTAVAKILKSK